MPTRRTNRRLIPLQRQSTTEFRFVGGRLDVEPPGSSIKWISCAKEESTQEPAFPEYVQRSAVTFVKVDLSNPPRFFRFKAPCSRNISEQLRTRTAIRE